MFKGLSYDKCVQRKRKSKTTLLTLQLGLRNYLILGLIVSIYVHLLDLVIFNDIIIFKFAGSIFC